MRAPYSTLAVLGLLGAACAPSAPPAAPAPQARPAQQAAPAAADTPPAPARQAPPAALAARPMTFPSYTETTLPNGLRLLVVPDSALPVLDATLVVTTGAVADPTGKEGLAGMVADMLTKGTPSRSARQIAERIEGVGGDLSASADDDDITVDASALSDQDTLVFSLLSDVALRPAFPAAELQTVRTQTVSALRAAQGNPGQLGTRAFARAVYGSHPYGEAPEPASVQRITREDLRQFHRTYFNPRNALLVVAGDVSPERARELATRYFGGWRGGELPAVAFGAPPQAAATQILLVHRPGSVQSNLIVGNLGLRPDNPDYFAALVLNQVLGGGSDSRLFQILRQQKGWTYGSYSSFSRPRDVGTFRATAEVRTEVTDSALNELMAQIRRVRDEPVSDVEFQAAKSYLLGSYPLRFETPGQIATQIATTRLLGLPVEHLTSYRQRVEAVTPADVQRVARQYLQPERATVVVVGDAAKLLPRLASMGNVSVVDTEGRPVDRASLEVRASSDRYDASRLAPMTLTYGVSVQGNAVGTSTTTLARDGQLWVATQNAQLGAMTQRSESRFTADLSPVSARQSMAAGPTQVEVDLRLEGGKVRGTAKLPAQMGGDKTFDAQVVAGTRFSGMETWALAVADLAEGRTVTLPIFNPISGGVSNVTAKVGAVQKVTVPAGTFDAYRVELAGSDQPAVLYLRRDAPHVLLKQELQAQPVVIELQSMR